MSCTGGAGMGAFNATALDKKGVAKRFSSAFLTTVLTLFIKLYLGKQDDDKGWCISYAKKASRTCWYARRVPRRIDMPGNKLYPLDRCRGSYTPGISL